MAENTHQRQNSSKLFVVIGRSRTGSNLLIHMLRQHPEITCRGEIFAQPPTDSWRKKLGELRSERTPWSGFKLFYYHAGGAYGSLWQYLQGNRTLPIVHMKRCNYLRAAVSRALASKTGQWALTASDVNAVKSKVCLDPYELEQEFMRSAEQERTFAEMFSQHQSLDLEYEDLAASPLAGCEKVTDMLGLPGHKAQPKTQKQNPEPLSALVANLPELKAYFSGTRWFPFFEEESPVRAVGERI